MPFKYKKVFCTKVTLIAFICLPVSGTDKLKGWTTLGWTAFFCADSIVI